MNATTAMVRRGGLRKLLVDFLLLICIPALIFGFDFFPGSIPAQTPAKGPVLSFQLKYTESGARMRLDPGRQEVKFRKEPDFGQNDKVLRRALKTGPGPDDFLGFAVNLTRRMLYLDLNQNLDLTDDPQGVYSAANISASALALPIAFFRGVRIDLSKDGMNRTYMLEPFQFFDTSSVRVQSSTGVVSEGYVYNRSSYSGEITMYWRKWQIQAQDNLDGQFDQQDALLLLPRPGSGNSAFRPLPFFKSLFIEGHQYQVDAAFGTGTSKSPLTLTFTEKGSPVTELALDGKDIQRLVLKGEQCAVLVDSPGRSASIPAGKYRIVDAYLQPGAGKPGLMTLTESLPFDVTAGKPNRLKVGAPFTGTVAAERAGNVLRLRYILKGAAGETYSFLSPDKGNPPKFTVYIGDEVVTSGSFQYG